MQIDYSFDSSPLLDSVKRLYALGVDMTPVTRGIAAVLASESEQAFLSESDPTTGKAWQPLSYDYVQHLKSIGKTGRMLQRTSGGLAMSLTTDFDAVSAAIGTNKIYGALQFLGGLPEMPAAPAAVPSRKYMGLSPDGIEQIIDIVNTTHSDAIKP